MNVSSLKAFSWLTAAALTLGLSWYVYTFVSNLEERQKRVPDDIVRGALVPNDVPQVLTDGIVEYDEVQRTFHQFDWTGKPPPPKPEPGEGPGVKPPPPPRKAVADILRVLLIQEDGNDPQGSSVYIEYKPSAGVVDPKPADEHLRVGDKLLPPHIAISVSRIRAEEGVFFKFEEEGREDEVLNPRAFDPNTQIVRVSPDGARLPIVHGIPKPKTVNVYRPKKTQPIGSNLYRIGTEDGAYMEKNYAQVLTRDLKHRRHKNAKTGKHDGIEIQSVRASSIASRHGVEEGDVIKSINGHPVTTVSEAVTFVKNNVDRYTEWVVEIENRGRTRTVTYESPAE